MQRIIEQDGRTDWNDYTASEKLMVENTVLLVGLLYNMCKIQFVLQSQNANALNIVNHEDIQQNLSKATRVLGYIQGKEKRKAGLFLNLMIDFSSGGNLSRLWDSKQDSIPSCTGKVFCLFAHKKAPW